MTKPILIAFFVLVSASAYSGELEVRTQIHEMVSDLFAAEDFEALEALASTYRTENSRTPSGLTKLGEFYIGLSTRALAFDKDDQAGWEVASEALNRWVEEYSESPTPYVTMGAAFMGRGWAYRGEGWIRGVERQDIDQFQGYALRAAEYLMQESEIASRDPHFYYVMADAYAALGVSTEVLLALVNEGLDRYPDYDSIYIKVANYLSPKWRGSLEDLEDFAKSAVMRTKDSHGYQLYTRIYWAAGQGGDGQYAVQSPHASWTDLVRGMDEILVTYPDQWNINNFAFFGCLRNDPRTARRYLEMVEEPVPSRAWGRNDENYLGCRRYAGLSPSQSTATPE